MIVITCQTRRVTAVEPPTTATARGAIVIRNPIVVCVVRSEIHSTMVPPGTGTVAVSQCISSIAIVPEAMQQVEFSKHCEALALFSAT